MRESDARERRRLKQIAFHQAGHAVAAHLLGVAFDGVSVFPDEFERGEHLPLSSPDIGADVHIKILVAGMEGSDRFASSQRASARDSRRDAAQVRGLMKGTASGFNEKWSYFTTLRAWLEKAFARPAVQAAVRALATALLAHGRLDGQHAREIIREARKAARSGQANSHLALSTAVPEILPALISAVPAPASRDRSYQDARMEQLIRQAGSWDELLEQAERFEVPKAWRRGTNPKNRYPHEGFEKSRSYVLDHDGPADLADGMRLVLGIVSFPSQRRPFRHAWVELPNEVVFEGAVQSFFTRRSYYSVMGAVADRSYGRAEVISLIANDSDFGFRLDLGDLYARIAAYRQRFGLSSTTVDTYRIQEPPSRN